MFCLIWSNPKSYALCRAQVVGWPPVRSYRKNTLAANATKTKAENEGRSETEYPGKVDLKTYLSHENISLEFERMFSCFITCSQFCSSSKAPSIIDYAWFL